MLKAFTEKEAGDGPLDLEVDMDEKPATAIATPPADEPAATATAARTRSLSRVLTRNPSGVIVEPPQMKPNAFMTVPAKFNPQDQSPQKGKKRGREKEKNAARADAAVGAKAKAAAAAAGGDGGADPGTETEPDELDLSLMPVEPIALGAEKGSPPPRKKSRP